MFLKKIEAASGQTLSFETEVNDVSFSIDDNISSFFSKRNLPNAETDTIKVEGKLKWQVTFTSGDKGIEMISVSVPNDQKLLMKVSYYVDKDGDETKEIQEEITLTNVKVTMNTGRHFSTDKNKMMLNLRIDEIYWYEDKTWIEFRAGS